MLKSILKSATIFLVSLFLFSLLVVWLLFGGGTGFQIENGKPAIVSDNAAYGRKSRPIPGADAATFKALENAKGARATYALDAKQVYIGYWHNAMSIDSADPATFSIFTPDGAYTKDKDRVYWFGVELEGADPATFRIIKSPYAIDANRAFAGITPFAVRSLENFEVLKIDGFDPPIINRHRNLVIKDRSEVSVFGWSRDGIAYYWGSTKLKGAAYDSLTILNTCHAKDKKTVYYRGKRIRGADAESFVIVGPGDVCGRDKNYEYKLGKRIGRVEPPN